MLILLLFHYSFHISLLCLDQGVYREKKVILWMLYYYIALIEGGIGVTKIYIMIGRLNNTSSSDTIQSVSCSSNITGIMNLQGWLVEA